MKPRLVSIVLTVVVALIAFNAAVTLPVALKLGEDSRNSGVGIYAYRTSAVSPTGLTVDLLNMDREKAPLDLFRALFQAAGALKGRHFATVTLARRGTPIFRMAGPDFEELGTLEDGQNPMYLIRTLPEKLVRPSGAPAFGTWQGGMLGVLTKQLGDVNSFAAEWVTGKELIGPTNS